ncbi:hypothetical protein CC80DRAFT_493854 [Byssothecium circinans]|uniref:Uncharacterized protein n=1 Tax=Byssothecium circinans TaxID=147558 RepID=A0A6A5TNB1_9PLEO|nr:hypothetical protein CC80DRAFT_493854 [Byssothecium circinans]
MTYTITIENKTGDANQAFSYIAFGFPHPTSAIRGGNGLPVVFYQSRLLNDEEPASFTISEEVYGFLGNSSQTNATLTYGAIATLTKPLAVTLGGRAGDGTELEAKPNATRTSVEFKAAGSKQSSLGTFSIIASNALKENNKNVVGLARKVDNVQKPVSVFPLHPGQTFEIAPVESIYIARNVNNTPINSLVNPDTFAVKQQVDLMPDQPNITVTNVANAPLPAGAAAPAPGAPSTTSATGFQVSYH